ncbi:glycosyltransferase family 2 protein [Leptolyngbya sp. FACHB-261]|uniref:glycosyltransferase family 2 protein n=1 Tax=Leptolyngbya sp. FACHB-261 TaxID=2692806 RepID=UPI00168350B7|nr:glycosyltransferase [Leptolyngbya sp. FACHB-261]MBD2100441.1 glycosyltransferase [Leptolyngbya sp. FACHB-261]
MEIPEMDSQGSTSQTFRTKRLRWALLAMLAVILLAGLGVLLQLKMNNQTSELMGGMAAITEVKPWWLSVLEQTAKLLTLPAVALPLLTLAIIQASPQPRFWSRWLVIGLFLVLLLRYVGWRFTTLNLSDSLNATVSLGLFALEMLVVINGAVQWALLLAARDRRSEADQVSQVVASGQFTPSVDILIPTYDEPEFIVRRTIIGCQALDYANVRIYLLDDTRRPVMKALAQELGCEYLTRSENQHAKAGNLNHAILLTSGELIVCFDADFVPTRNFLTRTVGFFQDKSVALVQTPQSFYAADPVARNLGLESVLTPEQEVFYRQIEPTRDGTDSVVCAGTSFVMRRSALEAVGGQFVTQSLSEDYFTAVRLSAGGYRLIYLDEKLSAGAAPDNMADYALQRLRWAQGTLQAFFVQDNPLTLPGLRPVQRLAHFSGIFHWFTSLSRVGFLLAPLLYSFLGVIPVRSSLMGVLDYFLPYYLLNLVAFSWLNGRSRSLVLSDVYDLILTFPLCVTIVQTLLNPFGKGFKVTPKGTQSDQISFNFNLAWPLLIFFVLSAASLWMNLSNTILYAQAGNATGLKGLALGWVWSSYNVLALGVALLVMMDVPKRERFERFNLHRTVKLRVGDQTFWGQTDNLSESGAQLVLTQSGARSLLKPLLLRQLPLPVDLELMEEGLHLRATVTQLDSMQEEGMAGWESETYPLISVCFQTLSLAQHRQLVELLFCRPGQWQHRQTPGELRSLFLLLRSLVLPYALTNNYGKRLSVTSVAKT